MKKILDEQDCLSIETQDEDDAVAKAPIANKVPSEQSNIGPLPHTWNRSR